MSIHVTNWVLNHSTARRGARLVLLVIAESAEHDGSNAWPSVETIATRANMSERAVQYALRQLERGGHIITEIHAGGPKTRRADRRTNSYQVVMDSRGAELAPRRPHGVQVMTPRGASNGSHGVQVASPEPSLTRPEPSLGASSSQATRPNPEGAAKARAILNGLSQKKELDAGSLTEAPDGVPS